MLHKDLGELENIISQLWITTKVIEQGKRTLTSEDFKEINSKIDLIVQKANELKSNSSLKLLNEELPPPIPRENLKVA